MRTRLGWGLIVALAACDDGSDRDGSNDTDDRTESAIVVPASVEVSADRRTLTVVTYYPDSISCGHLPGGLEVDVADDVALITARMQSYPGDGDCFADCAGVTQTITLPEPLPTGVRFEAPADAEPGCVGPDRLTTVITTPSTS